MKKTRLILVFLTIGLVASFIFNNLPNRFDSETVATKSEVSSYPIICASIGSLEIRYRNTEIGIPFKYKDFTIAENDCWGEKVVEKKISRTMLAINYFTITSLSILIPFIILEYRQKHKKQIK